MQLISGRRKHDANVKFSDKELFTSMAMKDPWMDADMVSVFCYMFDHPKTMIPDSWLKCMTDFRSELLGACADPALVEQYNASLNNYAK